MRQNKARETLAFCLGILFLACLVETAGWIRQDRLVFPDVAEILRAFFRLLTTPHTYLLIWTTLRHLLQALVVSSFFGLLIGLAEGFSDFFRSMMRPVMIFLRSIPMIVMVVILMVLTRYDRVPLLATSLFLIPLISEATNEGCRGIDPDLIDVYRLNSSFNGTVLTRVYLPLMAGYWKQAYTSAVGMGLKLVVSTEYLVQTRNSLGKAINNSSYFNEYQDIYAYALIMILLVLLVSELPLWLEKLFSKAGEPG